MTRRAVVIALALTLGACSFGSEPVALRTPRAGSTPGGTLRVAIGAPGSIDPAHAYEPWGQFVASLICDPLIALDPITGEPKPAIAESWTVSNRGTQITLKLRKGVRFHDGSALSSEDVVAALTRVASEEEGSNVASLLRPIVGWEFVHGDAKATDETQLDSLAGARAIGPLAVQIVLREPRADFLRVLAHPLASPEPHALVARDPSGYEASPVCTGPYRLTAPWRPGDRRITLRRFDGYYANNTAYTRGGAGYADSIVLEIGPDARTANVDAAPAHAGQSVPDMAPVTGGTSYLEYVGLPTGLAPFDRRDVRLALSLALDRSAIARRVYGGARAVARGFLPPALGPVARDAACAANVPAIADVARAQATLRRAGVDLRGRRIDLFTNPDFSNMRLMRQIAAAWRAAFGADVRIVTIPWSRYQRVASASGGFRGPFRMGWQPAVSSPDEMLAPLFWSDSIGRDNLTRFNDPRFDRQLTRTARTAATEQELRDGYRLLENIVCEQLPALPVVFGASRFLVREQRIGSAVDSFLARADGSLLIREMFVRQG